MRVNGAAGKTLIMTGVIFDSFCFEYFMAFFRSVPITLNKGLFYWPSTKMELELNASRRILIAWERGTEVRCSTGPFILRRTCNVHLSNSQKTHRKFTTNDKNENTNLIVVYKT